jgi:predicted ATPase
MRVRGELLLHDPAVAIRCFEQAMAIARAQGAKLWELRAAVSLARLWRDQGKHVESLDLLAPVYAWFTEGFESADLVEARALLTELVS